MYILSQDKTRIYNMSGHIEGIGYEESKDYKQRKSENIRHTIQVFDGCAEEIAEFKTKEDCMLVIYAIFKGMEQDSKAVEIPTQEEISVRCCRKGCGDIYDCADQRRLIMPEGGT